MGLNLYRGFDSHRLRQEINKHAPFGAFCFFARDSAGIYFTVILIFFE